MACLHAVHSQISIHAPPRGATGQEKHLTGRAHFNSRPSARGDVSIFMRTFCDDEFQFTPLREGRRSSVNDGWTIKLFQFTPLREGRRFDCLRRRCKSQHFNSRPSARGDAVCVHILGGQDISIHAPPRGATRACSARKQAIGISIHAPPRGATISFFRSSPSVDISIHAPPRGATDGGVARRNRRVISIHAPPRGATLLHFLLQRIHLFQFTPLREGRQSSFAADALANYFNSRPSARGDR